MEKEEKDSVVRPGQVGWVNSEGVQEGWVDEGLLQGLVDLKIADLFLAGQEVAVQAPVQVEEDGILDGLVNDVAQIRFFSPAQILITNAFLVCAGSNTNTLGSLRKLKRLSVLA